jgi:hypothetical protein
MQGSGSLAGARAEQRIATVVPHSTIMSGTASALPGVRGILRGRRHGAPVMVLSRGEVIVDHGEFTGRSGRGNFVKRTAGPPLV